MANSSGIYLEMDGKILLLCDERWSIVPLGICVSGYQQMKKKIALEPGDPVICRDGYLHFASQWLKITEQEPTAMDFGSRVCRESWLAGIRVLRGREKGLAPLAEVILTGKSGQCPNALCTLALPRLNKLWNGLWEEDISVIEEGAKGLLGLGPGLTPSGDDVLCGLLYGLLRSSCAGSLGVKTLVSIVCREADGYTHPVSAAYLQAIAREEPFGRLEEAWLTLRGLREGTFESLLEVGSSSGGDLLLGLLLAGKICMEREAGTDARKDCTGIVG